MIPFPADVLDWLRQVFLGCNQYTTEHITRQPNTHEVALDMSLINSLSRVAPRTFGSGWSAFIKTHFLGAKALWGKWEIADIGLLVMYRSGNQLKRTKLALLQSKRLYPDEQEYEEDTHADYMIGFSRLYLSDPMFASLIQPQQFTFQEGSRYKSIQHGSHQEKAIAAYSQEFEVPIYYLFYNPAVIPWSQALPVHAESPMPESMRIGCRVVPEESMRTLCKFHEDGQSPSYAELLSGLSAPFDLAPNSAGWSLETFFVDLLCGCEEGKPLTPNDDALIAVFRRRSGPISAAISINLSAPDGYVWGFE